MRKPLILVTCGKQKQATARGETQTILTGCDIDYVTSVLHAGGAPVLLPCISDTAAVDAALAVCDGVLLTGGGDILSLAYREEPNRYSAYQDPTRDSMELEVVRVALTRDLPILGICRGMQLLNVAFGGTLIQDIPSQVPQAIKHYSQGIDTVLLHNIDLEADSLLAHVMGDTALAVNSYHHQTVKDVGAGLRVNCRSRDGVAEGVEAMDGRPILAVQFHPEECATTYGPFGALFEWLVQEAREKAVRTAEDRTDRAMAGHP